MTTVSGPSCSTKAAECPCGSAKNTTSCPVNTSTSVASSTRPTNGSRCGWCSATVVPALAAAVSAPMVSRPSAYAGCPRISRRISPPAYPLAPASATDVMQQFCMLMQAVATRLHAGHRGHRRHVVHLARSPLARDGQSGDRIRDDDEQDTESDEDGSGAIGRQTAPRKHLLQGDQRGDERHPRDAHDTEREQGGHQRPAASNAPCAVLHSHLQCPGQ